jgi:hypothetical protein
VHGSGDGRALGSGDTLDTIRGERWRVNIIVHQKGRREVWKQILKLGFVCLQQEMEGEVKTKGQTLPLVLG